MPRKGCRKEERKELIRLAVFWKSSWKSQRIYPRVLGDMTLRGWKPTLRLIHPGHLLHWTPHICGFLLLKVTHGWTWSAPLRDMSIFHVWFFEFGLGSFGAVLCKLMEIMITYRSLRIESCYFLSICLKLKMLWHFDFFLIQDPIGLEISKRYCSYPTSFHPISAKVLWGILLPWVKASCYVSGIWKSCKQLWHF